MTGPDYTRLELARIAADAGRPAETRRAAAGLLTGLMRLDIRLALDAGCVTHEARVGETDDVVPLSATLDWARPQVLPVIVLPGVGHFFHGQLALLKSQLVQALQR